MTLGEFACEDTLPNAPRSHITIIHIGDSKDDPVEGIEEICAELKVGRLPYLETLDGGDILVVSRKGWSRWKRGRCIAERKRARVTERRRIYIELSARVELASVSTVLSLCWEPGLDGTAR